MNTSESSATNRLNSKNESNSMTIIVEEDEIRDRRRNIALEYLKMEEKQASLCNNLATKIYRRFDEINKTEKLCEQDDLAKIFHSIIELEKVAELLHGQVAIEIRERVEVEKWKETPYFGDILKRYFKFYNIYKQILLHFPKSKDTLVELMKKQKFKDSLQKLLAAEASSFDNITRLDIHIDQIVNLPRRYIQLFQSYVKVFTDKNCQEYKDMSEVLQGFLGIFDATDENIDRMRNFQECFDLQQMIEPPYQLINDNSSKQLIKHGDLKKISKKTGESLARHLILINDVLLICGYVDILRRKYLLKYELKVSTITIIENSDPENDLIFRIISPEQNNEFLAEDSTDKANWIKAFKKLNEIKFDSLISKNEIDNFKSIGEVPPTWIKDSTQTNCSICKEAFTLVIRRHHCRTCGKIFCGKCSNLKILVKFDNYKEPHRVCKICFNLLAKTNTLKQIESANTTTVQQTATTQVSTTSEETNLIEFEVLSENTNTNDSESTSTVEHSISSDSGNNKLQNELKEVMLRKKKNDSTNNSNNDTSSTTTTTTNEDEEDSVEVQVEEIKENGEDKKSFDKIKQNFIKNETKQNNVTKGNMVKKLSISSLKNEDLNNNSNQQQGDSSQILFSDSVLISRLNLNKVELTAVDVDSDKNNTTSLANNGNKTWERKWITLTDDRILSVFSCKNVANRRQLPSDLLNLNNFELINLDESSFELKRLNQLNEGGSNRKTKSFINLFEYTNYELKFSKDENKSTLFNLIESSKKNINY